MAFSAPPTVASIGKNTVVLFGSFNLASGATGVIGFFGSGAEVELPEGFGTGGVDDALTAGARSALSLVTVEVAPGVGTSNDIRVEKVAGAIEITNADSADPSGDLTIYVHFLHSYTR